MCVYDTINLGSSPKGWLSLKKILPRSYDPSRLTSGQFCLMFLPLLGSDELFDKVSF